MSSKSSPEVYTVEDEASPLKNDETTEDECQIVEDKDVDFIIIDSVGCTEANVEALESAQDSQEEPDVVLESGLFCLDTTPQVEKGKSLGPRFRTVLKFLNIVS